MIIFDGLSFAAERELVLAQNVQQLKKQGVSLTIAAVLFCEDAGSRLYTRLKSEAAARVGIQYRMHEFSLLDPVAYIQETIVELNADPTITGIIIQKPWRKTWIAARMAEQQNETPAGTTAFPAGEGSQKTAYTTWWEGLTSSIDPTKDVDGLHPSTLQAIEAGTWKEQGRVLPATAQAVLNIVRHRFKEQSGAVNDYGIPQDAQISILGQSDIVGKPLFFELKNQKLAVEMLGTAGLQAKVAAGVGLTTADLVISATGSRNLITGDLLKPGVTLIDVGEPQPDVDHSSVGGIPSFITPVPGGVGPMTVVCLLENCMALSLQQNPRVVV